MAATLRRVDLTSRDCRLSVVANQDGLYEVEFNCLISREIIKGVTVGGGYVRSTNHAGGTVTRHEDRVRGHVCVSGIAGQLQQSGRVRLEYRLRSDGDDAGLRLRPQMKAMLPIGGPASLVASHESSIPLDDTDWGQRATYEQMRNFVGVVWKPNATWSIETGYVNQYGFGRGHASDLMDHALSVSTTVSL